LTVYDVITGKKDAKSVYFSEADVIGQSHRGQSNPSNKY
jgi:hypothetical protein